MNKSLLIFTALTLFSLTGFSQNQCSQADLAYMNENAAFLQELTTTCTTDCLGDPNSELCVNTCILENTPLSESCASCFSAQVNCVVDNCLFTCFLGTEEECVACATEFCLDDFNVCAGIEDVDQDSFDTLSDCDDTDPTVYPGAPGTQMGLDNNCNGEVEGDELALGCVGDFNLDGIVTVVDLTVLLSDYGCLSIDCTANIDDVDGTTSNDLTIFLINFGSSCQ